MVPVPTAEQGNVSVVVRVRPQTSWEQESNRPSVVQVVSDCMLVFDPEEPSPPGILVGFQGHDSAPRRKGKDLKFVFDRVFDESATQAEVFENTTKEILDGVLNGYNCSGKEARGGVEEGSGWPWLSGRALTWQAEGCRFNPLHVQLRRPERAGVPLPDRANKSDLDGPMVNSV